MSTNFLEIIVSLCIIALMLLGLDAVQLTSLYEMKSEYFYAIAQRQIMNMVEYVSEDNSEIDEIISTWNKQNCSVLPNGFGLIEDSNKTYKISIFWGDRHDNACIHKKIGTSGCLQLIINKKE